MNVVLKFPRTRRADTVATLLSAFERDPAVRTLYPTDVDYFRHFPGFLHALAGPAFEIGVIDRDPDRHGASLWLPPGVEPRDAALTDCLEGSLPAGRLPAVAAGMDLRAALRPLEPHWSLTWIGVAPEAQRRGIGTRLIGWGLTRVDAEAMPAYTEATSPGAEALFARFGFEPIGTVETPGLPAVVGMWRTGRRQPFSG